MKRDKGDIIDRFTIATLKAERIGSPETKKEYYAFLKAMDAKDINDPLCEMLMMINSNIWKLEASLKGNKEELVNKHYIMDIQNTPALRNIGITTILIRDWNNLRVKVKNYINIISGEGFQDQKQDHLSED